MIVTMRECGGPSVGRKGELDAAALDSVSRPSDEEFKVHLERVLNPA